jgi:hypothetical protein
MRIRIIRPGEFTGDDLVAGELYDCVLADDGTEKQNRAFHALLQCYWASGCHSYNARNFEHFRALIKLYLGAGMEKFCNVANADGTPCPEGRSDYRLKSWADYTKKERKETIDRLIAEMEQAGVNSAKYEEILKGMNETVS